MAGRRHAKKRLEAVLLQPEMERALEDAALLPARETKELLFSLLSSAGLLKWRAVSALGRLTARETARDPEAGRDIMRRLVWSLNEESGAVPFGAPEALGEIMAVTPLLAREFANILSSYIWPEGNFLEFPPLQEGVAWGLGRLAMERPAEAASCQARERLLPFLDAPRASLRGTAAWALGNMAAAEARGKLETLTGDTASFEHWDGSELRTVTLGGLAREALEALPPAL